MSVIYNLRTPYLLRAFKSLHDRFYSNLIREVSSEDGAAPPPAIVKPCKISLPNTYIMYDGRTSQAPLMNVSMYLFDLFIQQNGLLRDDPQGNKIKNGVVSNVAKTRVTLI